MSTKKTHSDPLGRLAAHARRPYPEGHLTKDSLADYWRWYYDGEAAFMDTDDLRDALHLANQQYHVVDTQRDIVIDRLDRLDARIGALSWEEDIERSYVRHREIALTARLTRLNGRLAALSDELEERRNVNDS